MELVHISFDTQCVLDGVWSPVSAQEVLEGCFHGDRKTEVLQSKHQLPRPVHNTVADKHRDVVATVARCPSNGLLV